ncbi:MAG TPA: subclass B3 metallo-beta-lactamase [Allosphingosinicella sp.]|nr:subclass B3 metallo-beta-lactamase [Allosphingosinicella sp.]
MGKYRISAALCLLAGVTGTLAAQNDPVALQRTEAGPPFRIADNLYHVGASDSAVYLIVGKDGMILLDAGFAEDSQAVLANVEALGFDPRRIRYLLNSQAHQDHAGGLAAIKARTGAMMLASRGDKDMLERGGTGDFAFGDRLLFPPVKVDRIVADGEIVSVGGASVTAHPTPGHTKGCTSWSMKARDGGRTYDALFICGASAPGYRLVGNEGYPGVMADFRASFAKWRRLKCELFLGAHGSYFGLEGKRARMGPGRVNPFVDPAGCRQFLAEAEKGIEAQAREQAAGK